MSEQDLVWEEPAPAGRSRRRVAWPNLLEPLKQRPGEWARIVDYVGETSAYKVAQKLRDNPALPPEEWEFRARKVPSQGSRLYARYLASLRRPYSGSATVQSTSVGSGRYEGSADLEAIRLVYRATRRLLHATAPNRVIEVLVQLVKDLGGFTKPASELDERSLPVDLSFGEGAPVLPAADKVSVARLRLEEFLPGVIEDARRVVALLRRQQAEAQNGSAPHNETESDPDRLVLE